MDAVVITASGESSVFLHQLIIRDNIAKRLDGGFGDSDDPQRGLVLGGFYLAAVAENNILDVTNLNDGVSHGGTSANISVFNNMRSDGKRLLGYDSGTGRHDPELATEIEALCGGRCRLTEHYDKAK